MITIDLSEFDMRQPVIRANRSDDEPWRIQRLHEWWGEIRYRIIAEHPRMLLFARVSSLHDHKGIFSVYIEWREGFCPSKDETKLFLQMIAESNPEAESVGTSSVQFSLGGKENLLANYPSFDSQWVGADEILCKEHGDDGANIRGWN